MRVFWYEQFENDIDFLTRVNQNSSSLGFSVVKIVLIELIQRILRYKESKSNLFSYYGGSKRFK